MRAFLGRGSGYNSEMPHNYHLTLAETKQQTLSL